MRTLLKVCMEDTVEGNNAISDGRLQKVMAEFNKDMKPETVFFYSENGYRTASFIFDMKDPSQIPQIAESFFFALNAKVFFFPVMNEQELSKGLEVWNKKDKAYLKETSSETGANQIM